MGKCKWTKEQWREWRRTHREQYLANQRKRFANMSPEKRVKLLAKKKEWHKKHDSNYGVGRGHGRHYTLDFSQDEYSAHRAALRAQWAIDHPERIREYQRKYYEKMRDNPQFRKREKEKYRRYIESHYQKYLAAKREKSRRRNDKTRLREYRPRMYMRIPEWVTCSAQARHIERLAAARRMAAEVSIGMALDSGLTVGRFSR